MTMTMTREQAAWFQETFARLVRNVGDVVLGKDDVIALAFTGFRVTVDRQGLRWRGRLGLPRGHVPLEDIASSEVVQVDPSHYGGWGYRLSPVHGTALVTRGGSALRVTRRDGRRFTITVDDAGTGAALLEALSHRA